MVPQRLCLRNFLCYRDNCPPLDLSGISMACLSGENGHGKSALLDAITWSLWGEARARSDDELIHAGRVDMEVELEFRLGCDRYRVIRKRRRGTPNSPGRTLLEFQVWAGEGWRPLTGTTVRETQARIVEAVRLDYDTFRNSAFLMQGRADEFTLKAAGERKKVLAEILGLSRYDVYEGRAKDERKRWDAEARRIEAVIGQYTAEVAREPLYKQERDTTAADLDACERDLGERRDILQNLRETERSMRLLRSQLEETERRREEARLRVEQAVADLAQQEKLIADRQALLARADEIRARFAAHARASEAEREQTSRLARLAALRDERAAAQQAIEREAAALRTRIELLESEEKRLLARTERRAELAGSKAAIEKERQQLEHDERRIADLRQELQEQTNASGQLQAANKRLREDMQELKRRQSELAADGGVCPICRTELGEDGKRRVLEGYEHEGHELAVQHRQNRALLDTAERRCQSLDVEARRLDAELARRRTSVERAQATLDRDLHDAEDAAAALPTTQRDLTLARAVLERQEYSPEARERLAKVAAAIEALGYDEALHARLREELKLLSGAEREHTELKLAEQAVENAQKTAARTRAEREDWQLRFTRASEQTEELGSQLAAFPDTGQRVESVAAEVAALEAQERALRTALGAAEQNLDNCRRYRDAHDKAQTELTAARGKLQIYDDLAVAFGRKGVQALIIDSVIPEIEEEANRLLARMTNGRMSVALNTQRSTQKGTALETLDISIADELGTRAYEMFSGGEAFRINLALRIALSKLLARRAGAPLPTLIVDEGFGTQDAAGRERLLEAMNAVSRDFECLIVITHIDELKDQFERQIRVEKTADGSIATVV